jgi:hypothetical protein
MANDIAPEDLFDSKYLRLIPVEGEDLLWDGDFDPTDPRLWTIVDADGDLLIVAGYHFVNRLGYLLTVEPWASADEEYIWQLGFEDEE